MYDDFLLYLGFQVKNAFLILLVFNRPECWFVGVTRHVGAGIGEGRSKQFKKKLVTIGVVPWGVLKNKEQLIGKNVNEQFEKICAFFFFNGISICLKNKLLVYKKSL